MIEVGMRVRNLIEGREGIVVFSPYIQTKGFVAVEYGSGITVEEMDEANLETLGFIKVETDERCGGCVFNNYNGDKCVRFTRRRFIALCGDRGDQPFSVPSKPYPQCKEEAIKTKPKKAV